MHFLRCTIYYEVFSDLVHKRKSATFGLRSCYNFFFFLLIFWKENRFQAYLTEVSAFTSIIKTTFLDVNLNFN